MIARDPAGAAAMEHDLVVVGGGIYGACLALEASRRGLRPVLVERADFGQETSWNSLRIVHGGFRYLQTLDLRRFRESVEERRWFLRNFPEQVRPLACLMPLYGDGLRRPSILRVALGLNDFLSRRRNDGVRRDRALGDGEVLSPERTRLLFPSCRSEGLRGAALWYDAVMADSQRLLIEILRWAAASGSTLLNYVEADALLVAEGVVRGVSAVDRVSGERVELRAPVVVNCAGPWCREVCRRFDRDLPALFRPSLAFNALLDRAPIAETAVAVTPRRPQARTYFLHPWKGHTLAGTFHAPRPRGLEDGPPEAGLVRAFLDDLNDAVPELRLQEGDVRRLFWGLLPAKADGADDLAVREVLHDHAATAGPRGLWSVSGVKFTTARRVAEKTLRAIFAATPIAEPDSTTTRPQPLEVVGAIELEAILDSRPDDARALVGRIVAEESAARPDDVLLRRTDWGIHPLLPERTGSRIRALVEEITGDRSMDASARGDETV